MVLAIRLMLMLVIGVTFAAIIFIPLPEPISAAMKSVVMLFAMTGAWRLVRS